MKSSVANALQEDPSMIVDDNFLIQNLNLSKSFINQHARAMGAFSKPRKFFLKYVMNHLDDLAMNSISKVGDRRMERSYQKRMVDQVVDETLLKARMIKRKN
ncbi:MAG: hypothetical protein C4538_09955 [Nitrospiraceae bacterium]|nr:MAG: hypothetical protein C4538_09955 [Nitrospiraceae bacterium]